MDFEWQYLEKGKALCGKVFPNFVDTWKRVLDVLANAKGDADVDETQGHIKIDRSDPAHPVIRYVTPDTSADGGGGSGGDGSGGDEDEDEETDDVVTSANGATGDVNVIGGKGIEVSTDGQTIKVSWNKDKEEEDEDPDDDDGDEPSNPCEHDKEGGGEGGVEAGGGGGDGGGAGIGADGAGGGGVPAGGGESHTGDDNCNCG